MPSRRRYDPVSKPRGKKYVIFQIRKRDGSRLPEWYKVMYVVYSHRGVSKSLYSLACQNVNGKLTSFRYYDFHGYGQKDFVFFTGDTAEILNLLFSGMHVNSWGTMPLRDVVYREVRRLVPKRLWDNECREE